MIEFFPVLRLVAEIKNECNSDFEVLGHEPSRKQQVKWWQGTSVWYIEHKDISVSPKIFTDFTHRRTVEGVVKIPFTTETNYISNMKKGVENF